MYAKRTGDRINQGDLVKDFNYKTPIISGTEIGFSKITLPFAVVISQDCDLEQDFKVRLKTEHTNDKYIPSVLLCPAFNADQVKEGTHLKEIGYQMNVWGKEKWRDILSNQNEGFHHLPASIDFGFPDLIIDFKQYFTIPRDEIYEDYTKVYIVSIGPLYREDLAHRFASYLSRIGLPEASSEDSIAPNSTT